MRRPLGGGASFAAVRDRGGSDRVGWFVERVFDLEYMICRFSGGYMKRFDKIFTICTLKLYISRRIK